MFDSIIENQDNRDLANTMSVCENVMKDSDLIK